jgi:glutathionyl-hydroquinone reductase
MTDTGFKPSATHAFVQKGASDWSADALADDACEVSDAMEPGVVAGRTFFIKAVEDNTGAINGVCTVAILEDSDGTNYENQPGLAGAQVGGPDKFQFTPVQNDTVYVPPFTVSALYHHKYKVAVLNESGQELAISVEYKDVTVPAASA